MTEFAPAYPKCSFTGEMIFPGESFVADPTGKHVFRDETALDLWARDASISDIPMTSSWLAEPDTSTLSDIDPVEQELISGALRAIWQEMQVTMTRSAYSPVFYEGEDYTVAILDRNLKRVSQREGFPSQMGAMEQAVKAGVLTFGWENIAPDDVILHNSALMGTPHLPEFCMLKPVFADDEVVAVVASIAHHADVGGKAPGGMPGDSRDIHQEGVIIPPVKLFEAGRPKDEIWRILLSNTRTPRSSYGDFMAMYGSLLIGERRVLELAGKVGVESLRSHMRELQRYAERRVRQELARIPDGLYEAEVFADDDGITERSHRIRLSLRIAGSTMLLDFRGTDPQAEGPINCPYAVTLAACANAVFSMIDPTIPHNAGAYAPLRVIAPAGTLVNCDYPAPLSAGNTESHNLVAEAVIAALRPAVPERVLAPTGATTGLITGGGHRAEDGEYYTYVIWEPTGYGARLTKDGYSATTWVAPQARQFPTEVIETEQPWRVIAYARRQDSGGPGRQRGGLGVIREYEILGADQVINSIGHFHRFAAGGVGGGMSGLPLEIRFRTPDGREQPATERGFGTVSPAKFSGLPVTRGETVIVRMPGGGGWGDPRERDREAVRDDLADEVVSVEAAIQIYGLEAQDAQEVEATYGWERRRRMHRAGEAAAALDEDVAR
jgi:N-methylhydantoinase B/oxoprolinase/acetone carboxylase alpha subunit